jgi:hypothetical protein
MFMRYEREVLEGEKRALSYFENTSSCSRSVYIA